MQYILSLGSNQPPREERLRQAIAWLSELSDNCFCSTPYSTAPIGRDEGNECKHYLNAVVVVELGDRYDVERLQQLFKAYEAGAGRTDQARAEGKVPIDIDVVIAGKETVRPKDFDRYYFRQGYEELLSNGLITP
ncbi:MAG: 2-amino-4-hydroxy-6-hydroxymethyldihydropteridine diphosphokinase [Muribaculaceae bacterium]|nr:2-amino-4-hydroxy-6-hydroxymethyldihydropteridine diphosphokinase [Muribaculaceae bacterium]